MVLVLPRGQQPHVMLHIEWGTGWAECLGHKWSWLASVLKGWRPGGWVQGG